MQGGYSGANCKSWLLDASQVAQWKRICLQCRIAGMMTGSGRFPEEGNGNPLHILA